VNKVLPPLLASPAPAVLALADGTTFEGFAAGPPAVASGEVVFNTSAHGYQEMVSDPSYRGQILVLTTPHVGVVGTNEHDQESARCWAEAMIVPDLEAIPSSWRSERGLLERLAGAGVPVAWGFDTRALVLHVRRFGALPGVLSCGDALSPEDLLARAASTRGTDGCDLVRQVACTAIGYWREGPWLAAGEARAVHGHAPRVAVVDCGVKRSILRRLVGSGAEVVVVPPDFGADDILALRPRGVVVSNGPGDPAAVAGVADTIRGLLGTLPLLGICLGHQLLALALGGRTFKLRFGHHGANHPVRDERTGLVWITSQNHNYAVDPASLPKDARVSLVNLTDGTVEGIVDAPLRAEGIQFHPEAGPGPHDALAVFDRFVQRCRRRSPQRGGSQ